MGKRVLLFLATNLAILIVVSVVFSLLGYSGYIGRDGALQLVPLLIFCFIWGMAGSLISLQLSRWIAKRSMGVQLVDGRTGNQALDWLYQTVANQARMANLPMPEVGVYESPEVNAFATGPSKKRSLVAVSTGLLHGMQRNEVEAVLGHEVGHIKNGDMVTMALLQGVLNAFVMFLARIVGWVIRQRLDSRFADMISFVVVIALDILLGILASMIVAAYSRHREFHADEAGAKLAGRGNMVAALRRLMANQERIDTSNPTLAAYKISNRPAGFLRFLSTHPPLEVRIAALERMQQA
jgi:heat shock protein HtpX